MEWRKLSTSLDSSCNGFFFLSERRVNESPVQFLKTRSTVTHTVPHRERRSDATSKREQLKARAAPQPSNPCQRRSHAARTRPASQGRRPSCFSCRHVPEEDTGFCGPTASHFDAEHHQPGAPALPCQLRVRPFFSSPGLRQGLPVGGC